MLQEVFKGRMKMGGEKSGENQKFLLAKGSENTGIPVPSECES